MAEPWWSYDIFAVGLIYIRLLCPTVKKEWVWTNLRGRFREEGKWSPRFVVDHLFSAAVCAAGEFTGSGVCPDPLRQSWWFLPTGPNGAPAGFGGHNWLGAEGFLRRYVRC